MSGQYSSGRDNDLHTSHWTMYICTNLSATARAYEIDNVYIDEAVLITDSATTSVLFRDRSKLALQYCGGCEVVYAWGVSACCNNVFLPGTQFAKDNQARVYFVALRMRRCHSGNRPAARMMRRRWLLLETNFVFIRVGIAHHAQFPVC